MSHFDSLSEKVICVFGGTSGIGKSIVEAAKSYGAHAYGFSRRTGVDVKNAESVRKALEEVHNKHGQIHYVVNTAAIMNLGTIEAREYDSIKEEIEINYFGSVVIAKETPPVFKRNKRNATFVRLKFLHTWSRVIFYIFLNQGCYRKLCTSVSQRVVCDWNQSKCY